MHPSLASCEVYCKKKCTSYLEYIYICLYAVVCKFAKLSNCRYDKLQTLALQSVSPFAVPRTTKSPSPKKWAKKFTPAEAECSKTHAKKEIMDYFDTFCLTKFYFFEIYNYGKP